MENSENENELQIIFTALGTLDDETLLLQIREMIFKKKIPSKHRVGLIQLLAINTKIQASMWLWYLVNLDNIEKFSPIEY